MSTITPAVSNPDPAPAGQRRFVHSPLERCVCQNCGSHVHALALQQIVSGLCGTCGSCDIARLEPGDSDPVL